MKTLAALDTLVSTFITQYSAGISSALGEIVLAVLGLALAWIAVRHTKIKTSADGAVDTVEAKSKPRVDMDGLEKKWDAARIVSEATGISATKLDKAIQAAFDRRKDLQKNKIPSVRPPV